MWCSYVRWIALNTLPSFTEAWNLDDWFQSFRLKRYSTAELGTARYYQTHCTTGAWSVATLTPSHTSKGSGWNCDWDHELWTLVFLVIPSSTETDHAAAQFQAEKKIHSKPIKRCIFHADSQDSNICTRPSLHETYILRRKDPGEAQLE